MCRVVMWRVSVVMWRRCGLWFSGETRRVFQHSRSYDGTLVALVKAGVKLLVSDGPDDTAALLAELAQVERRKGQAVSVPLEVRGHGQQALQFYLTLPRVSYVSALNMCHHFSSVSHMINRCAQWFHPPAAEKYSAAIRYFINKSQPFLNYNLCALI